jgi:hypothetical protein
MHAASFASEILGRNVVDQKDVRLSLMIAIIILTSTVHATSRPAFSIARLAVTYFGIQRARVNGVTLSCVLINEPRAPASPRPTFSPLDSTPSIFNHKEVSTPPSPPLSRLLLWSVMALPIYSSRYPRACTFSHSRFTCLGPRDSL